MYYLLIVCQLEKCSKNCLEYINYNAIPCLFVELCVTHAYVATFININIIKTHESPTLLRCQLPHMI